MATITAQVTGRLGWRLASLFLFGLVLAPGCVLTGRTASGEHQAEASPASGGPKPTRVVVAWQPKVLHAADPTRNGAMNAGLAGRLYLFGEDLSFPLVCHGKVLVELYDLTPRGPGQAATKALETWEFDPVTLKRLLRKDLFGEGYTLFLPWGTYRPDITRVQLRTRFEPTAGPAPLYGEPAMLNLSNPVMGTMSQHGPIGPNIEQVSKVGR